MQNTSLLLLTIWSVFGAYLGLLLTSVGTFTNQWVFTSEERHLDFHNGTLRITMNMYSGLLESCRIRVTYIWDSKDAWKQMENNATQEVTPRPGSPTCVKIRNVLPAPGSPPKDITSAALSKINSVWPFPVISFLLLIVSSVLSTLGLCIPTKRAFMFFAGVVSIIAGLFGLTGIVCYIIAVGDAVIEKHPILPDKIFQHTYGYSFCFCALSFVISETTGVASLYLFIKQETYALRSEKERLRHRLMVSGSGTSVATGSTQVIPLKLSVEPAVIEL
ncbi:voltage-dependent calcium channel gamma-5 subunit-like [Asterias rubens]|uniref:voltage-dependent calcium channel gamma-5 subunit-like n=1 Tax=Asterias rubens TaxID=7604 RepID=UPI0014552559|nr:voltage-dependent calcium channel gamma-5 subunit-like [Asterias rubens]